MKKITKKNINNNNNKDNNCNENNNGDNKVNNRLVAFSSLKLKWISWPQKLHDHPNKHLLNKHHEASSMKTTYLAEDLKTFFKGLGLLHIKI